LTIFTKIYQSY